MQERHGLPSRAAGRLLLFQRGRSADDETLASMGLRYWVLVKGGATVGLARRTSGLWNFGLAGTLPWMGTE